MNKPSEAKFLEIVTIDRRQFLRIAGGALVAVGSAGMMGCGGGGASGGTQGTTTISGNLQLPSGSSISPSSLVAVNLLGQSKISSSGKFAVNVPTSGPSLVTVQNSSGNGVYFGFVGDPQIGSAINAASSAVVLLYFVFGCASLPASVRASVIEYLNESPVVATFAQVVAARVSLNPTAIEDGDAQIGHALIAAYTGLGGTTPSSKRATSQTSVVEQPAGLPLQVLVQPGSAMSGFQVVQGDTAGTVIGTNTYHRPSEMFLYRVGDVSTAGVTTPITPPQLVGTPTWVSGTASLSIGTTLSNLFSGKTAFTPVNSAPLALNLDSGQAQTQYETVVLFSSASTTAPAFYSDPKYTAEVPIWQTEQRNLTLYSFFIDLVLAGMLEILGVRDVIASEIQLRTVAAQIAAIEDTAWQQIVASVQYGAFGPQLQSAVATAIGSDVVSLQIRASFAPLVALVAQRKAFLTKTIPSTAFTMIKGAYAIAGVILGAGDVAAVIADVSNSDQGDLWTASVSEATLHLNPATVTVVPGSTSPTSFTVSIVAGATGTFVWTWTLTGGVNAQLTDEAVPTAHKGTTLIDISATTVYLLTTPSDTNTMTLQVQGFSVGTGGALTSIGTASSEITIQATSKDTLLPTNFVMLTFPPDPVSTFGYVLAVYTFAIPSGATVSNTFTLDKLPPGTGGVSAHLSDLVPQKQYNTNLPFTDPANIGANALGALAAIKPNVVAAEYSADSTYFTLAEAQALTQTYDVSGAQIIWIDQ